MARSIAAVVVGYLVLTVLVVVLDVALVRLFPASFPTPQTIPTPPWLVLELILGLVFTAIGGYVAGMIARRAEVQHALALGILGFVLSIGTFVQYQGRQPLWFQLAGMVMVIPAAVAGGYLRARHRNAQSRGEQ